MCIGMIVCPFCSKMFTFQHECSARGGDWTFYYDALVFYERESLLFNFGLPRADVKRFHQRTGVACGLAHALEAA